MRRLALADRWLLGGLLALFAVCFLLHVSQIVRGGFAWLPFTVEARGPEAAPTVKSFWTPDAEAASPLAEGDVLLAVGDEPLVGTRPWQFAALAYESAGFGGRELAVRFEGAAGPAEGVTPLLPVPLPLRLTFLALALVVIGTLAFVRSGGSRPARIFFLAAFFYALHWCYVFGGTAELTLFGMVLLGLGPAIGVPLAVIWVLQFPEDTARTSLWHRTWPWVFAPIGLGPVCWAFGTPLPAEVGQPLSAGLSGLAALALLVIGVSNFRRTGPAGRRQLKWLVFGGIVAMGPILTLGAITVAVPAWWPAYEVGLTFLAALPAGALVAIVNDHLFDIDQLLTKAASLTVFTLLFLGGALFASPLAAEALSGVLDPAVTQATVAMATAGGVLWARSHVEPRVQRWLFRERAALEESAAVLRSDLGRCEKPAELYALLAERLSDLLEPTGSVLYAASGEHFHTVAVHGPTAAPSFARYDVLSAAISAAGAPVRASVLQRAGLGGFEASALAAMGTEVVLPIEANEELQAFLCLGSKRSGDEYTGADLAILGGIADRAGASLQLFGRDTVLAEQRAMVDRLQRFVPGAIAGRVQEGASLEPGEREVSVLFVDIRGYTGFSEGRRAEAIFSAISRYTEEVSEIVNEHGGAVVDFSGDGLMAAFGAHHQAGDKEAQAVAAARAIVLAVRAIPIENEGRGTLHLDVGVGVATGEAFVGTIQSADRAIWCVLGNTTNLAARLEGMTRNVEASVIVDATTHARSLSPGAFFGLGPTDVKGRSEPLELFALPRDLS